MSLKIAPYPPTTPPTRDLFLSAIEENIAEMLPANMQEQIQEGIIAPFLESIPLFKATPRTHAIVVSFMCHGEYTNGAGRYFDDTLSRWLIPGENLIVLASARLAFSFVAIPHQLFFFGSTTLEMPSAHDAEIAEKNLQPLIEEMRLNIQAVYRARYITTLKSISREQQQLMMHEHLSKMLNLSPRESSQSLFDHLHGFFVKLNREEKMGQVQQTIAQLAQKRPKTFDREMFSEMTYFTVLFKDEFASKRQSLYISRVIALHYLFKKVLLGAAERAPQERHISFKVYKTKIHMDQPVLGILLGMTILHESEGLDRRFLFNAIRACIPGCEAVKDSYLFDRRDKKAYLFYIEVHKPQFTPFSANEVDALRVGLPQEIKKQIANDLHPIFFPRNEEEIARNLLLLGQQLRRSRDLPQVSIQYEKQSQSELFFSILIARLRHPKTKGLREQFFGERSDLQFSIEEMHDIGKLRKTVPKETAVVRVSLNKETFFRADYSVDLLRARQKVAFELGRVIGEYRDFNGGMILKQEEALLALRKQIGTVTQETESLLEDYFYSLRPGIMQTALPPDVLGAHFALLNQCIAGTNDLNLHKIAKFYLFFGKCKSLELKPRIEAAIEELKITPHELTSCFFSAAALHFFGYIFRSESATEAESLKKTIEKELINCNTTLRIVKYAG